MNNILIDLDDAITAAVDDLIEARYNFRLVDDGISIAVNRVVYGGVTHHVTATINEIVDEITK